MSKCFVKTNIFEIQENNMETKLLNKSVNTHNSKDEIIKDIQASINELPNYRFRIDWPKWKTAVDKLLADREDARTRTEKKRWHEVDYYYSDRLTKLYSIRAQARGRIHRKRAELNQTDWNKLGHKEPGYKDFLEASGSIKFDLTIEDQAKYIGDTWKEYERHPSEM